ncbi:MAG: hypothetical protein WB676_30000 [Bryobacteraceae bacterium]
MRPTPLEGENGIETWMRQFKWYYFEPLGREKGEKALAEVVETLRPVLWDGTQWTADYRRLRIVAVRC